MARIPAYSPTPPALPGPVAIGEPLQAVTADLAAAGVGGYLGFLALGVVGRQHLVGDMMYDGVASDFDDDAWGPLDDYPIVQAPNPIRIRRTAAGRYIWLGIWALAHEGLVKSAADQPPRLSVSLVDADGLVVDGPIEWGSENGYLPLAPKALDTARGLAYGRHVEANGFPDPGDPFEPGDIDAAWLELWRRDGATPERYLTTGRTTEVVGSDPRMLAYPADDFRVFDLVFEVVGVRVYSVSVLEAYTPDGAP